MEEHHRDEHKAAHHAAAAAAGSPGGGRGRAAEAKSPLSPKTKKSAALAQAHQEVRREGAARRADSLAHYY